jgi:hypothetical protein
MFAPYGLAIFPKVINSGHLEKPMKKAKSDQLDPAEETTLRIVQKIRKLPPDAQIVFERLVDLPYEVNSKPKAGSKDD